MSVLFWIVFIVYLIITAFILAWNAFIYHDAYSDYEKEQASRRVRRAILWPLDSLKAIQDAFHNR